MTVDNPAKVFEKELKELKLVLIKPTRLLLNSATCGLIVPTCTDVSVLLMSPKFVDKLLLTELIVQFDNVENGIND